MFSDAFHHDHPRLCALRQPTPVQERPVVLSSLLFCFDRKVVVGDEEVDGFGVAFLAFGEGVSPSHQAAQACAQCSKPAFHMIGFTLFFAAAAMGSARKSNAVGFPEVAARGPSRVVPGEWPRAERRRSPGCDLPACRPRSGGSGGTGPPTASRCSISLPQSSRVRPAQARRPFHSARACPPAAAESRFFSPAHLRMVL